MLYGNEQLQNDILKEAREYADNHGYRLIFASMVGSISQGLQYPDSDYDTRFLYVEEDFPDIIRQGEFESENNVKKRVYPQNKVYEWIPFWEASSFFDFLRKPALAEGFSTGLYNIVGWTMFSPYVWDPYSIQNKIIHLINTVFFEDYKCDYQFKQMIRYQPEWKNDYIVAKSLFYSVYAAACIEWSRKYKCEPPVDLQSLLLGLGHNEIWSRVNALLVEARHKSVEKLQNQEIKLQSTHFNVMVENDRIIVKYIKDIYFRESLMERGKRDASSEEQASEIVKNILSIISCSLVNQPELLYDRYKDI